MIARVRGKVVYLRPAEVIVETAGGTGYHLFVPLGVSSSLEEGKDTVLETSMYVREDLVRLYGFSSLQEKEVFETLLRVNGGGPSMALALLSGMGVPALIQAVEQNNIRRDVHRARIGKVKAEKLLFELRRHLPRLASTGACAPGAAAAPTQGEDAIFRALWCSVTTKQRRANSADIQASDLEEQAVVSAGPQRTPGPGQIGSADD
jgi:Holliday junction DNA helicase RuvA